MESLWNSPDIVSKISVAAQWVVAITGIIALIFTMRSSTLKDHIATTKEKKLEHKIEIANTDLVQTKKELENKNIELTQRVVKTEKIIKPKPFKERARILLDSISPGFLPALKNGQTEFNSMLKTSQFTDLQKLCSEDEAINLTTFKTRTALVVTTDGHFHDVVIIASPNLLK